MLTLQRRREELDGSAVVFNDGRRRLSLNQPVRNCLGDGPPVAAVVGLAGRSVVKLVDDLHEVSTLQPARLQLIERGRNRQQRAAHILPLRASGQLAQGTFHGFRRWLHCSPLPTRSAAGAGHTTSPIPPCKPNSGTQLRRQLREHCLVSLACKGERTFNLDSGRLLRVTGVPKRPRENAEAIGPLAD